MYIGTKTAPNDLIVVHTNEGPEGDHSAQGLSHYLDTIQAGYQEIIDNQEFIIKAGYESLVYGAGGVNNRAYHLCVIGYSAQTAQQWDDAYSNGELTILEQRIAAACRHFNIPVVKLGPSGVAAVGTKGICGHGDVSAIYPASQGHTDPGPAFPWGKLIAGVDAILHPNPIKKGKDMRFFVQCVDAPTPMGRGAVYICDGLHHEWVTQDQQNLLALEMAAQGYPTNVGKIKTSQLGRSQLIGPDPNKV